MLYINDSSDTNGKNSAVYYKEADDGDEDVTLWKTMRSNVAATVVNLDALVFVLLLI
jgi:hypothetical protein